jgi:rubrerythrin
MSKKFTLEEVNEKVKNKSIKILSYESILKPVNAECLVCGHKWITQANVLINNSCGCPVCNHKKAAKKLSFTKETFMESCGELKSDIVMIGEYTKFQEKTTFHCNTCNYTWKTTPYMIKKFKTCPNCTHNRKLTHEEYVERVKNAHGDSYEVLSQYNGLSKKIKVKHKECENEFETNALNFIGTGKKTSVWMSILFSTYKIKR